MSKNKDMTEKDEVKFSAAVRLLQAKQQAFFTRLQTIYDSARNISSSELRNRFVSSASNVNDLRSDYLSNLDNLNLEMMKCDPNFTPDYNSFLAFEDMFSAIKKILQEIKESQKNDDTSSPKEHLKLPPINLQTFDGDIKSWPSFFECYNNAIHYNTRLNNSEKVFYFCGVLSKTALATIAGIPPTGDNYKLIYSTLVDKYQDTRTLGTSYLQQILNMNPITTPSAEGLYTFLDTFTTSISAFEKLDIKEKADFIYLHLALQKIDCETARLFEQSVRSQKIPTYSSFVTFLREQAKILERTSEKTPTVNANKTTSTKVPVPPKINTIRGTKSFVTSSNPNFCSLCDKPAHEQFFRCSKFMELSPNARYIAVKKQGSCCNCLSLSHKTAACNSTKTCGICHSNTHHTLLHFPSHLTNLPATSNEPEPQTQTKGMPATHTQSSGATAVFVESSSLHATPTPTSRAVSPLPESTDQPVVQPISLCSHTNATKQNATTVLLATARVVIRNSHGKEFTVRALIDNGSMNDFVTTKLCNRLSLNVRTLPEQITVNGFGGSSKAVKGVTNVVIHSRFDRNVSYNLHPLVVDNITDRLPTSPIDRSMLDYISRTPLADDTFSDPSEVEMLIGAQLFPRLILSGHIRGPPGTPDAIQTPLGYILLGEAPIEPPSPRSIARSSQVFCAFTGQSLDSLLRSFWETEEVCTPRASLLSKEEQDCEGIYETTTTREPSGSYVVALPFKTDPRVLGDSLKGSQKRFCALEKRLQSSLHYRNAYDKIIEEYCDKDYIAPVLPDSRYAPGYVIPHHGVIREDILTTKVRLVLDASSPSDTDLSLNDILHAGPNLQPDLFLILLNFRLFPIGFCADVEQMYLRIKVHPEFYKYQRILYRFDLTDPIQMFEFKRVCFGLTSSPYLALRTLRQLADDEQANFPLAAEVINRGDYYMDDVVVSVDTLSQAKDTALQLIDMFSAGEFKLHKWSSNSKELLSSLPQDHLHPQAVSFDSNSVQKILGVTWDPFNDNFNFVTCPSEGPCTKRHMLSVVARLWDVMGFAAPLILYAKLLIKELWLLKLDWDAVPPQNITDLWNKFQQELPLLKNFSVPRHIGITGSCHAILLAFSDASEKGYGAALYIRTQTENNISVRLLCAKSKIAPVQTISLARLELMGVHLMTKLIHVVTKHYSNRLSFDRVYAFCDSTVALSWINSSPHRLKTFVANRVTKIQEYLEPHHFYHISGKDNPSDCLSRGLTPSQLISHALWINGPSWTLRNITEWPVKPFLTDITDMSLPELKSVTLASTSTHVDVPQSPLLLLAQRVSSWSRLLRIVTYVLRFSNKLKSHGDITADDLEQAELAIIRAVQQVHFSEVIKAVKARHSCTRSIQRLRPFLVNNILRVGGRLGNSDLTYDHKHPILMPAKDHVVDLIVDHIHRVSCHAGPQLVLSLLRQHYWILSARRIVRSRIHSCVPCFKVRPKPAESPVMANLPPCRLQMSKPFTHVGVDYAGPLFVTMTRKRGVKSHKAYLSVFVCLTTRAAHIEVAPDMSTDAFLNAFKRFLSRRGPVQRIYSDHGTNFVGARAYLDELQHFLNSESFTKEFKQELATNHISWDMVPPNAPHFGGGWEATVKSFKNHLFRVIGAQILTYEELLTVLCQIEAILNSRPLGILSEDPADPVALTPSHFLNTRPLCTLPSVNVPEVHENLLSRYMLLDRLVHSYWRRWRDEYLHTLQIREKWNTDSHPIREGMIVLIMQDNSPPLHWPLGIVEKTFTGTDGLVRVALVKTKTSTFKRPVIRLCPLPIIN